MLNIGALEAKVGYDEPSTAIARGEMDDGTLGRIATPCGMAVIGPVSEGYV